MKVAPLPLIAGLALTALAPLTNGLPNGPTSNSEVKRAPELQREWIAPEAQLVVHFDFEAFQKASLWKVLEEHADNINFDEFDEFRHEFGIDPFTDLKSLTAYSRTSDSDDGVALIRASGQIEQALTRIKQEREYSQITIEGLDLHVWTEHGEAEAVAYVHTLADGDRVIVFSDHQTSTIEAARIVRGEAPNHKSADGRLPITPALGSFFYLSTASIPGIDDLPPASRLAGLTKNIHIDIGETNGVLNATVSAMTASPEDALQASKMIEGFKAIGYFAAQEFGVSNLLEAIRVNTRGSQIIISFSYNVRDLVEEVKALEDAQGPF